MQVVQNEDRIIAMRNVFFQMSCSVARLDKCAMIEGDSGNNFLYLCPVITIKRYMGFAWGTSNTEHTSNRNI